MTGYGLCLSILLQPKPEQNLSGAKRKATTPPTVGANNELSSVGPKKKHKEEWSCALCQVSATSERGLNEHLQGKKHKAKEAGLVAQRAGKSPSRFQKKFKKAASKHAETDAPGAVKVEKLVGETLEEADIVGEASISFLKKHNAEDREKKNDELLLQKNEVVDEDMKKNGEATKAKGQKPVVPKLKKKKKFRFWCELCQVGAYSGVVMSNHEKGKKHVARLQEISQRGLPVPPVSSTVTTPSLEIIQSGLPVPVSSTTMTPLPEVIRNAETAAEVVIPKEVNAEVITMDADEKLAENIEADEKPVANIEPNEDKLPV